MYLCVDPLRWRTAFEEEQASLNCEEVWKKYSIVSSLPPHNRHHCPRCGVLLLTSDLAEHEGHGVKSGVTDKQLCEPTCLVTPRENKKSQAVRKQRLSHQCFYQYYMHVNFSQQFYFSDPSLYLLCSELKRLKFSHILCVGTPRFGLCFDCCIICYIALVNSAGFMKN